MSDIRALTTAQIGGRTSTHIGNLTTIELAAVSTIGVAALSATQVQVLTTTQLAPHSPSARQSKRHLAWAVRARHSTAGPACPRQSLFEYNRVAATGKFDAGVSYFSIDVGLTNLGDYDASDGTQGDYSDWNLNMTNDPFGGASPGIIEPLTGNDVVEMAAIGWNMTTSGITVAQTAVTHPLV